MHNGESTSVLSGIFLNRSMGGDTNSTGKMYGKIRRGSVRSSSAGSSDIALTSLYSRAPRGQRTFGSAVCSRCAALERTLDGTGGAGTTPLLSSRYNGGKEGVKQSMRGGT